MAIYMNDYVLPKCDDIVVENIDEFKLLQICW